MFTAVNNSGKLIFFPLEEKGEEIAMIKWEDEREREEIYIRTNHFMSMGKRRMIAEHLISQ